MKEGYCDSVGWRGRTLVNASDGPRKVPEKLCWVKGLAFERKGNLRAVFFLKV